MSAAECAQFRQPAKSRHNSGQRHARSASGTCGDFHFGLLVFQSVIGHVRMKGRDPN
jgi:hypothetical protein